METIISISPFSLNRHLSTLIGKSVTIFVEGGGNSGSGFTGVLLRVHRDFITLISFIPVPSRTCRMHRPLVPNAFFRRISRRNMPCHNNVEKTMTAIPLNKIISIVHNTTIYNIPAIKSINYSQRGFSCTPRCFPLYTYARVGILMLTRAALIGL